MLVVLVLVSLLFPVHFNDHEDNHGHDGHDDDHADHDDMYSPPFPGPCT